MAPPRPVTLRDFLELGCDSSSDGFRTYPRRLPLPRDDDAPPLPLLVVAEADHLRRTPSSFSRSPSSRFSIPSPGGALTRISSSLSRSFSRRIKEGFWRRRFDDDEEDAYFDDRDSCGFPSPLVSSCSSASDSDADADVTAEDDKPASAPASSSSSSDGNRMQAVAEGDSTVGLKLGMIEDKQQLSPVSVLDFPFDDDDAEEEGSDAGTCSPTFQRRPASDLQIRTTKPAQQQLRHKVRRYDPVDLDARFVVVTATTTSDSESVGASTRLATSSSSTTDSSSGDTATTSQQEHHSVEHPSSSCQEPQEPDDDDEEPDDDDECRRLLARLLQEGFAACLADDEVARALVLDFFAEGLIRVADDDEEEALVGAAAEWLRGAGPRWGVADVVLSGKAALADMERGRRWMCVAEEEREVGAALVDALVDELVAEMVVPCCLLVARRWPSMEIELPVATAR